ncbi:hypothetical protein [Curtobacterium sp. MCPF17_046]|uniref:hypothetical protein n=1 Tax=Curtobacterium sp. MCPF17_046 TaxID=2175663 RepID=UPI0011B6761F|nr:hypothetical protein [Curtobacterium sp. MCPF17_046]
MGDNNAAELRRVRLRGERFTGGRLPVASLVELQKYQRIVQIAAEAEWRRQHPGDDLPADFADSVGLTIERIEDGSADVYLAFEQQQAYVQYQADAQDAADAFLVAAYSDAPLPAPPTLDPEADRQFREALSSLGASLEPNQSIDFYPVAADAAPITISVETRAPAIEKLSRIEDFLIADDAPTSEQGLQTVEGSVVAHVTAINAARRGFEVTLADGAVLRGSYQDPDLLEDLRAVVDDAANGPLTRIVGHLQYRDGELWRFRPATGVERIQFDDTAWGRRLTQFASLRQGWDDGDGAQISAVALDAAQALLRRIDEAPIERPGVFPTEEGGVLAEWGSAEAVASVEVLPDGTFELFAVQREDRGGVHRSTVSVAEAFQFVQGLQS